MSEIVPSYAPVNPDYVSIERHVLQDNINLIDAKSGILMALSGAFIVRCLDKVFDLSAPHVSLMPHAMTTALALYAIASVGFFVTAFFTWHVVRPRVVKTNDLIYWSSDVFLGGAKHFVDTIEAATAVKFREDFLRHIYVLALICRQKYKNFGRAMRAAELSLLTALGAEIARYLAFMPVPLNLHGLPLDAIERTLHLTGQFSR